jgi:hypothetical protein
VTAVAPWAAVDIDPDRVIAELRRRFPGARAWWGEFTGAWWAISRDRTGRHRLVEAPDPAELGRRLESLGGRMASRSPRPAIRTGAGAWVAPPPPEVSRAVSSRLQTGAVQGRRRRSVGRRRMLASLLALDNRRRS